jgi:hypothetical protein
LRFFLSCTLRNRAVAQASCACHFAERNCGESKNDSLNIRLEGDPQPFHVDRALAAARCFGRNDLMQRRKAKP